MNKRTDIKLKAALALVNAAIVGDNVKVNRTEPFRVYPGILVHTPGEVVDFDTRSMGRHASARTMQLIIEIQFKTTEDYEEAIDDMTFAVEDVMSQDPTVGGTADCCDINSIEFDYDDSGDELVAVARMNYEIKYSA